MKEEIRNKSAAAGEFNIEEEPAQDDGVEEVGGGGDMEFGGDIITTIARLIIFFQKKRCCGGGKEFLSKIFNPKVVFLQSPHCIFFVHSISRFPGLTPQDSEDAGILGDEPLEDEDEEYVDQDLGSEEEVSDDVGFVIIIIIIVFFFIVLFVSHIIITLISVNIPPPFSLAFFFCFINFPNFLLPIPSSSNPLPP